MGDGCYPACKGEIRDIHQAGIIDSLTELDADRVNKAVAVQIAGLDAYHAGLDTVTGCHAAYGQDVGGVVVGVVGVVGTSGSVGSVSPSSPGVSSPPGVVGVVGVVGGV